MSRHVPVDSEYEMRTKRMEEKVFLKHLLTLKVAWASDAMSKFGICMKLKNFFMCSDSNTYLRNKDENWNVTDNEIKP